MLVSPFEVLWMPERHVVGLRKDPLLLSDGGVPITPIRKKREEDLLVRRSDYLYLITFGGISTVVALLLVCFSLICSLLPLSGSKIATLVLAFQIVHFFTALTLITIGGWLVYALTRKVLASSDASARKSSWNAGVGAFLLGITAIFDVISTILQILGSDPSISWMSVAEDVWTIPETLVVAVILILLELNRFMGTHYRRAKIALLPLITGLSLSFMLLNIVGVNTWDDVGKDMGVTITLCRTLAVMYRGGTLLMSLDHTMRAFGDLLHNPNRHAKAYEAGRPLEIGSGEFRAVDDDVDEASEVELAPEEEFGQRSGDDPALAEVRRHVQALTIVVGQRVALFGRRPFASILSYTLGGLLLLVLIISRAVDRGNDSLDTAADVSLGLLGLMNIIGFGWFAVLGATEAIVPREIPWAVWAKQLPQASTLLRIFAPALLSVAWLLMVAISGVRPLTAVATCLSGFASLLQGAVFTYTLANFPLVFIVSSGPSSSQEALATPNRSSLILSQNLMQIFASQCVTLNVALLILSIWPDALSCAKLNGEVDIASRAIGAFFHAFCVGIAYNARSMFEFMSREEASVRTDLFKQLFSHVAVAQAQLQPLLRPTYATTRYSPNARAFIPSDASQLELASPPLPYSPGFARSAVSSLARAASLGSNVSAPYSNTHAAGYSHNVSVQSGGRGHVQQSHNVHSQHPTLIVQEDSSSNIRYAVPPTTYGMRPQDQMQREISAESVDSVEYTTGPMSKVAHAHTQASPHTQAQAQGREDSLSSVGYSTASLSHVRQESTDTISTLPRLIGIQHPVTASSLMDVSITM